MRRACEGARFIKSRATDGQKGNWRHGGEPDKAVGREVGSISAWQKKILISKFTHN